MTIPLAWRRLLAPCLFVAGALLWAAGSSLFGLCGPFTDVADDVFCPFVLEIYSLTITTGTTATTYDPTAGVTRLQMAAFLSRTVDRVLQRGSRRAALGRFWTPQSAKAVAMGTVTVATSPDLIQSDGADLWVQGSVGIFRYRASDGAFLQEYVFLGLGQYSGLLTAMGWVFTTCIDAQGPNPVLLRIDPVAGGSAQFGIPSTARSLAFDGSRVFVANISGSVSIVTVGDPATAWTTTTVTAGFLQPWGSVFDGSNVWVTDVGSGKLFKLDSGGAILQTVTVGAFPSYPAFDGTNIWVPNAGPGANSVTVVRASSGAVLATLTGNGINQPASAAFDGERILLTNQFTATVSLFKAADLTVLGSTALSTGSLPFGACSDGVNFWITLNGSNQIARF